MSRTTTSARVAVAVAVALTLAACTPRAIPSTSTDLGSPGPEGAAVTGEIVVLAAASLTDAFTDLGAAFEADHPGTTVTFSFGGSSGLAEQILSGAPADVFAAASTATMSRAVTGLRDAGVPGAEALAPTQFATSSMAIAVPLGNPADVTGLADLERTGVTFALCEEQVPCGAAAVRVIEAAGLTALPVTYEKDVTAVLVKVRADEVDAGIVYVTDIDSTVDAVEIPASVNSTTAYPILTLPEAPNLDGGKAFADFVLSTEGLAVLADHGFAAP